MVPRQNNAGDIISLRPCRAALTFLDAKRLFYFSMILLDLPANGAYFSRVVYRGLINIICHDPFRAGGSCRNPK